MLTAAWQMLATRELYITTGYNANAPEPVTNAPEPVTNAWSRPFSYQENTMSPSVTFSSSPVSRKAVILFRKRST